MTSLYLVYLVLLESPFWDYLYILYLWCQISNHIHKSYFSNLTSISDLIKELFIRKYTGFINNVFKRLHTSQIRLPFRRGVSGHHKCLLEVPLNEMADGNATCVSDRKRCCNAAVYSEFWFKNFTILTVNILLKLTNHYFGMQESRNSSRKTSET